MSYSIEKLEKSQYKLSFDVDAETFEKACEQAYDKTKHKYAIAGFRKGHVPRKVIEGIYGKEVFFEDAMDIVIPEAYGEALSKEENLDVVAQPELTAFDFKKDGGATFTLTITVKPEVKLGDYKGLSVEKKVEKISAKQVDDEIDHARERSARVIDVETPAINGNIVNIDFVGSVDGKPFEGGAAEGYDLELGSGSFIPGFEEQLVGVKAGDKKDVTVKFPEDYHAEELKGKEAVFACTIHAVKIKELPELTDDFVKEVSEFDTVADYKKSIKSKLEDDAQKYAERAYEDALVDAVCNNAQVEIPDAMIDAEAEDMVNEFAYRLQMQGLKMDDYLGYLNMTIDQLKAEYKEQAAKSVKVRLVMEAVVKKEDLKFSEEEIDAQLAKAAAEAGKPVEDFKKSVKKEQIDYLVNQILSDKLMNMLKESNKAVEKAAEKKPAAAPVGKEEKPAEKKAAAKKPAAKKADDTSAPAEKKPAAKKAPAKKAADKTEA